MSKVLNNFNKRKFRVRNKLKSCNKSRYPRLVVFRSNKNFYAQLIDFNSGNVIVSFSSLNIQENIKKDCQGTKIASIVGESFTKECLKNKIDKVVFDKGAYIYGGRVSFFADSCRSNGLKF